MSEQKKICPFMSRPITGQFTQFFTVECLKKECMAWESRMVDNALHEGCKLIDRS